MNAATSTNRPSGVARPGSRSSHWAPLTAEATPVAWPSACHSRAVLTTSARCIPIRKNMAIPLSTMPARLAPNSSSAPLV